MGSNPNQPGRTYRRRFRRRVYKAPLIPNPDAAGGFGVRYTGSYISSGADTTTAVPLPFGWQPGDVCLLFVTLRATTGVITGPASGWTTLIAGFHAASSTSSTMALFRRVLQAGDTAPVITTTSGRISALTVAVQGADQITPEDVSAASDANTASASASITAPSLTPVTNGALLICAFGYGDPTTANLAQSVTPPAGMAEAADICTNQSLATDSGVEVASLALAGTSATGIQTGTITSAATVNGMGISVVIRPAAVSGDATVTPPVIACGVSFPASTVNAGSVVTPGVISCVASFPAATINAGSVVTPATLAAVATLGAPALSTGSTVSPGVLQGSTAITAPSMSTGETVTPGVLQAVTSIPTPTVSAGGNATVTPATLQASASFPAPALHTSVLILPSGIALIVTLPLPAVVAGSQFGTSQIYGGDRATKDSEGGSEAGSAHVEGRSL